jgi:hypothetical protein
MAKESRVDTQAFLLERETLRDRLSYVRAYSLADAKRRKPWWLMLPLFPVAGWLISRGSGSANGNGHHPHPILKSFLTAAVMKLIETVAKGMPDDRPSLFKRIFNP